MTTLGEIRDAAVGAWRSRLENPFVGGFILSWVAINWKYVYVTVFVSADRLPDPYRDKLTFIMKVGHGWREFFLQPALFGLAVTVGLPILGSISALIVDFVKQEYRRLDAHLFGTKYHDRKEVELLLARIGSLDSEVLSQRAAREALEEKIGLVVGDLTETRRQLEKSGSAATSLQKELDATKADLRKCQDERSRALSRAETEMVDARRASDLTSKSEKEAIEKRLKQTEEALRVVRAQAEKDQKHYEDELAEARQLLEETRQALVPATGSTIDSDEWQNYCRTILQDVAKGTNPFESLFPGTWEKAWSGRSPSGAQANQREKFTVRGREYRSDRGVEGLGTLENLKVHPSCVSFDLCQGDRSVHVQLCPTGRGSYSGYEWRNKPGREERMVSVTYRRTE